METQNNWECSGKLRTRIAGGWFLFPEKKIWNFFPCELQRFRGPLAQAPKVLRTRTVVHQEAMYCSCSRVRHNPDGRFGTSWCGWRVACHCFWNGDALRVVIFFNAVLPVQEFAGAWIAAFSESCGCPNLLSNLALRIAALPTRLNEPWKTNKRPNGPGGPVFLAPKGGPGFCYPTKFHGAPCMGATFQPFAWDKWKKKALQGFFLFCVVIFNFARYICLQVAHRINDLTTADLFKVQDFENGAWTSCYLTCRTIAP